MERKIGIVLAARSGSSRLPKKALLPIGDDPMVIFLLKRLSSSRLFPNVILATTSLEEDDELAYKVETFGVPVFRGNASDLVLRYLAVSKEYHFDYIVRVTGDCPFVDGKLLDHFLEQSFSDGVHFDLSTTKGKFPIGLDFELFSFKILDNIHENCILNLSDREHLTKYIYDNASQYKIREVLPPFSCKFKQRKYTVDYPEDYEFVKEVFMHFKTHDFSVEELMNFDNKNY